MHKKISQRVARAALKALKAEVELNRLRTAAYGSEFPGGVNIATLRLDDVNSAKLNTAQKLGCAIVLRVSGADAYVYAVLPRAST